MLHAPPYVHIHTCVYTHRLEGKGEELAAAGVNDSEEEGEDDFDPVIAGPWMLRWKIGACRGVCCVCGQGML
jgi:hypothetical protein